MKQTQSESQIAQKPKTSGGSAIEMINKILIVTIVSIIILGCAKSNGKSDTYDQLVEVMNERKQLWFSDPPNRDADVSDLVCPIISPESMEQATLAYPQQFDFFLSTGATSIPKGTQVWRLKRNIDVYTWQILTMRITPDGLCTASYQHTS